MHTFNGFLDYLKLRSTREQELILVKAKDDFIVERGIKSENDEEWSQVYNEGIMNSQETLN